MSTPLLTNRFKPILKKLNDSVEVIMMTLAFVIILVAFLKSCNQKIKDEDIPDVAYKARALGGFNVMDTTKKPNPSPQMKITNHNYSLVGSDTLFNILWLQINSPIDVTPRQLNALKDWMQRGLKQDTTIKK
jgi:hypothetical protein